MPFSKIKTLLKILPILIFGFFAIGASAATEFVSIIDPDNAVGTDYTSLAAWEAAVQSDLTASSTLVFSIANKSGTPAIAVAKCRSTAGTADTTTVVVPIRE